MKRTESGKRGYGQAAMAGQPPQRTGLRRSRETSRHKHARGSNKAPSVIRHALLCIGLGSVGVLVILTISSVHRLDTKGRGSNSVVYQGFSYKDPDRGSLNTAKVDVALNDLWTVNNGLDSEGASSDMGGKHSPAQGQDSRRNTRLPDGNLDSVVDEAAPKNNQGDGADSRSGGTNDDRRQDTRRSRKAFGKRNDLHYVSVGGSQGALHEETQDRDERGDSGDKPRRRDPRDTEKMRGWRAGRTLDLGEASAGSPGASDSSGSWHEGDVVGPKLDEAGGYAESVWTWGGIFDRGADGAEKERTKGAVVINADTLPTSVPVLGRESALLIICANRPQYLRRALAAVEAHHPSLSGGAATAMPVIISQDGANKETLEVISDFKESMRRRAIVVHIRHPSAGVRGDGYHRLAAHYGWALDQAFDCLDIDGYDFSRVNRVIILEEDLEIAPDFFDYFAATAPLLDTDETLMAVSAWNDNGQASIVWNSEAIYRSDFFPGLGWMLPRRVWDELSPIWPHAYWDDWLREPDRRKGRQFLRPEVCRTYHFGKKGTSNNQFGSHLDNIKLNAEPVPFRDIDMSFLQPERFQANFLARVKLASRVFPSDFEGRKSLSGDVRVEYSDAKSFQLIARSLGLMSDFKAGVPRTAFKGVVTLWWKGARVFVAPKSLMSSLRQRSEIEKGHHH